MRIGSMLPAAALMVCGCNQSTARPEVATSPELAAAQSTIYDCANGSTVEASYPNTATATLRYNGQSIDMTTAISASGARYVGGGWQWWTKGMTEGTLTRLAPGETIASAAGTICTARKNRQQ